MNAHLPQRCVIALLASMIFALMIGLLAWGPVVRPPTARADTLPQALLLVGPLAMVAAGLYGLRRLEGRPGSTAWTLFFVAVALTGPAVGHYRRTLDEASLFIVHLGTGWTSAALMCAFLAERVDARWARWPLLTLGLSLATLSACHWLVGEMIHGAGDLRGHLLLQWLPLLLMPAGAVRLPGRVTTARDWYAVLSLYTLALLAEALGAPSSGPLLSALAAAWLAYRVGAPSSGGALGAAALEDGEASKASTSLNTSG